MATPANSPITFSEDPAVQARCETELARQMNEFRVSLEDANKRMMDEELEKFRGSLKPPSEDEIQKLLSQDYLEFTAELRTEGGTRTFTLRELPQDVERKFFKQLKDKLLPIAQQVGELSFDLLEGRTENKVKAVLEAFDASFDIMTGLVVLILNPFGKDAEITEQWVRQNLSSNRLLTLVEAQMYVNRVRDFFSRASQLAGASQTMGSAAVSPQSPRPQVG